MQQLGLSEFKLSRKHRLDEISRDVAACRGDVPTGCIHRFPDGMAEMVWHPRKSDAEKRDVAVGTTRAFRVVDFQAIYDAEDRLHLAFVRKAGSTAQATINGSC